MNRILITALSVGLLVAIGGFRLAQGQGTLSQDSRILRGKEIAPVTLNLGSQDPSAVYLGSYLVNSVGGCNDCHSCPSYIGTNPFQVGGPALGAPNTPGPINTTNYLAGGTPFGPGLASANITPDSTGKPNGLTLEQFLTALKTGYDPHDPGTLLQVMPWPNFRHMTDAELTAIYTYLSTLPPAQPGTCTGTAQTGM